MTPCTSVGNHCAGAPDAIRAAFGWTGVLGHHDFDVDDRALERGVRFLPMREIAANGLQPVIDAIAPGCRLYIALDVMDPAVVLVPAIIGPAPGGFSYWLLLEAAVRRATVVGFNLVELMPAADVGERGALVAARIVASMLGRVARQRSQSV